MHKTKTKSSPSKTQGGLKPAPSFMRKLKTPKSQTGLGISFADIEWGGPPKSVSRTRVDRAKTLIGMVDQYLTGIETYEHGVALIEGGKRFGRQVTCKQLLQKALKELE